MFLTAYEYRISAIAQPIYVSLSHTSTLAEVAEFNAWMDI